jgi:uncharacterized protein YbjT (DUF2867 family)
LKSVFFVSGITGQVGGGAARYVLNAGCVVRGLSRDPQKALGWSEIGVDVHKGSFTDVPALTNSMQGVEGAFLMLPPFRAPAPGFPEAKAMVATFQEALRAAPPQRLVLLSSVGSEKTSGLGNITVTHLLEEALSELPFPTAFVRAGSFLENYRFALKTAAATGTFNTYFTPTNRAIPMVSADDIGLEVGRLLLAGWTGKKIIELGTAFSPDELASAMSLVLGRSVKARAIPREEWTSTLAAHGSPATYISMFEEMEDAYNSGWIHFGVPGTEPIAATRTPNDVFADAHGRI